MDSFPVLCDIKYNGLPVPEQVVEQLISTIMERKHTSLGGLCGAESPPPAEEPEREHREFWPLPEEQGPSIQPRRIQV